MSPTPLDLVMFALPYQVYANGIGLAATGDLVDSSRYGY